MAEIYVSTDVETDGPIPGPHSMLSFASAAFLPDRTLVDTFEANLETLPGASGHPGTMQWWEAHPQAWAVCRADTRSPEVGMPEYRSWLEGLPARPVFVAYPAGFDFMFVYWYLIRAHERQGAGAPTTSGAPDSHHGPSDYRRVDEERRIRPERGRVTDRHGYSASLNMIESPAWDRGSRGSWPCSIPDARKRRIPAHSPLEEVSGRIRSRSQARA